MYNFDKVVDRTITNDLKWHTKFAIPYLNCEIPDDAIPMWLADTDFECCPVIVDAIKARADKNVFGYSAPMDKFYSAVQFWNKKRYDWDIKAEWLTMLPTVVAGINIAIRAFTNEGEGVIIQQPVYDPFASIVKNNNRVVANNNLVKSDMYTMNFEELEVLVKDPNNTLLILCSPHNPVGRVWKKDELTKLVNLCIENNVKIITDEIHSDTVYNGCKHYPLLSLDSKYEDNIIMLTSGAKAFNLAGLKMSLAIIPNEELRNKFNQMKMSMSLHVVNTFGIEALTAAYSIEGEEWLIEQNKYIESNMLFVEEYLSKNMPDIKMAKASSTFLCWLDFSALKYTDEELLKLIVSDAGVVGVPGVWFGNGGQQHFRLNVGCPQKILNEALDRIRREIYKK